jgi:hypothetical protein
MDVGLPGFDACLFAASLTVGVRGVSSSSSTPLIPVIMEASPLASQPEKHMSTPPASPYVSALQADFITPTRRSERHGAAEDGASVSDEDSMMKAM